MKGLQLTSEEKQLLVEALLFTANTEVCSDHSDAHIERMLKLAERINDPTIKLYNIYFYGEDLLGADAERKVLAKFPNIPTKVIID